MKRTIEISADEIPQMAWDYLLEQGVVPKGQHFVKVKFVADADNVLEAVVVKYDDRRPKLSIVPQSPVIAREKANPPISKQGDKT